MDTLTVLIADDHPVFRKGLRALLASMPNVELVGEATSGEEATRLAEQLQPDVILMDLNMPGGGGLAAIRQIVQTSPHIRILVVTMFQDDDSVFAALRAGARGYVLKDMNDEDISSGYPGGGPWRSHLQPGCRRAPVGLFLCPPGPANRNFPRADRQRAQCAQADVPGRQQRPHRPPALLQPQDRAQLCLKHF